MTLRNFFLIYTDRLSTRPCKQKCRGEKDFNPLYIQRKMGIVYCCVCFQELEDREDFTATKFTINTAEVKKQEKYLIVSNESGHFVAFYSYFK